AAHPGKPLIFQRTIYREWRNFNKRIDKEQADKIEVADSLMKIACKKYKDVYYIHPSASAPDHETSQDGTHPSDRGYQLWARSIEKPVKKILRKYGIR
ncbi:MAG: lipase, partial [Bacteroidales bacterium]|nr:lipase [Bacteroidales bacterium]